MHPEGGGVWGLAWGGVLLSMGRGVGRGLGDGGAGLGLLGVESR